MSLVEPPSLSELVRAYGSLRAAIEHLVDSGLTPERIEWKYGVPYHAVKLYISGFQPENPLLFSEIVELYDRIALLRSKKGKETELAKFLQSKEGVSLDTKIRLALGKITAENLKIGEGIVKKALSAAAGVSAGTVTDLFRDYGEYGEVAAHLVTGSKAKLTLEEVYESVLLLPSLSGTSERILYISSLFRMAMPEEARYLVRLLLGDLKLGYEEGTVVSAVSRAYRVPVELVEKVAAIVGLLDGLSLVQKGEDALSSIKIRPGQFLQPQLAHLYDPQEVSFPGRVEYKYDGSRLQVHKWGSQAWLFSRRGVEKSQTLPEAVEAARSLKAQSCIVDSEVIAVDNDGNPLPFQSLLERTVPEELSEQELEERKQRIGLTVKAFDILYLNGVPLMDLPLYERRRYLLEIVPPKYLAEGTDCEDEVALMRFYDEALKKGLEGVILKDLSSPYELGRRTRSWLKIKPERDTIDCTVVKAFYGKGRRAGYYSSFLMAVKDPKEKKLYTIGKVSNLPENVMSSLTPVFEEAKTHEDGEGIFVKPTVVFEVTYQEIQETDNYTSGYALRVPKVVRLRHEKKVEEIDNLEKLRRLFELQYERYPFK